MVIEVRVPLARTLAETLARVSRGVEEARVMLGMRDADAAALTRVWGHRMRYADGKGRRVAQLVYRVAPDERRGCVDVWGVKPHRVITAS